MGMERPMLNTLALNYLGENQLPCYLDLERFLVFAVKRGLSSSDGLKICCYKHLSSRRPIWFPT